MDLFSYVPATPVGQSITVSEPNLTDKLIAAQDNPGVVAVRLEGGGSITKQMILKKHTSFDDSTYSIDVQGITDQGAFLVSDGVLVEGAWRPPSVLTDYFDKGQGRNPDDPYLLKVQALTAEQLASTGTTILEPTYTNGPFPAVEVFQALGDSDGTHTGKSANIAIMGFHIKGRQKVYDGGVRSTILFGNCTHCAAIYNYLEDTASIGITFGGSALEKDNFANDVVIYRNMLSGVGAANSATINTENAYVFNNYVRRPGHHDPRFGGGVCGHDHETNSEADHTRNIYVFNNLYDYEDAAFQSVGNAICAQDPYVGKKQTTNNFNILNNAIIGGRGAGSEPLNRFMSNGMILVGLRGFTVANNYIFRTGQNAIQAYNIANGLFQDNDFESTGGGGSVTFDANGMVNTVLRRNNYRDRPGLGISVAAGFLETCGSGNVYEANNTPDHNNVQPVRKCP